MAMGLAKTANANGPYLICEEPYSNDLLLSASCCDDGSIMTDIYLCRHGRTALNAAGVLRGRLDPELDVIGMSEAHGLAQHLEQIQFSSVVSSPLLRAVQTAAELAKADELSVRTDERLTDRDYGQFNGAPESRLLKQFGSVDSTPGVESLAAVTDRALAVITDVVTGPGPVAVVTHCVVIRMILDALVPLEGDRTHVNPRTGSWSLIRFTDGVWSAVHLDSKDMA